MKNLSLTNWEKVSKISDEDIDFSDIPETTDEFWKDADWFISPKKDSLIETLKRYQLKMSDIKIVIKLVERLAH